MGIFFSINDNYEGNSLWIFENGFLLFFEQFLRKMKYQRDVRKCLSASAKLLNCFGISRKDTFSMNFLIPSCLRFSNVTERKELGVCQFSKNCGEKFNFLYKRIFNIPLSFFFFPLNVNFQRNPREVLKNIGEQLGIFRCIGTFLWEGIAIDGGGTRSNCERGSRISRNWIEVKTTLQFVQAWAVLNSFSRLEEGWKIRLRVTGC